MRTRNVLLLLQAGVRKLGLEAPAVNEPNKLADFADNALYFETYASDFVSEQETERSIVTRCLGTIVVSDALGSGQDRVDAIAQALLDLFSVYGAGGFDGGTAVEPIAGSAGYKRSAIYISGARRSNGVVAEGRYKVKVIVELEIYEEET